MPVEFQDYYAILGVTREASAEEIKKAFRKLARLYHPDIAQDKKTAEAKFKEINEAYEVLRDPEKRRKYDQLGAGWAEGGYQYSSPQGSWTRPDGPQHAEFHFGGTGFSDFFEQFFGGSERFGGYDDVTGQSHRRAGTAARFPQRGTDVESDILVTLDEVFGGSTRTISLQRIDPFTNQAATDKIRVRIPPGVKDGQTIRVRGKGGEGRAGGESGDLFLHVRLAAHPDFRIQGSNLYYELDLAPWEAVLGTKVTVATVGGGHVSLRIPAGSNNDQQLRIRGQGLPENRAGERGDFYVVLNVRLPQRISEEEQVLWEKLSRVSRFQPREK